MSKENDSHLKERSFIMITIENIFEVMEDQSRSDLFFYVWVQEEPDPDFVIDEFLIVIYNDKLYVHQYASDVHDVDCWSGYKKITQHDETQIAKGDLYAGTGASVEEACKNAQLCNFDN